MKAAGLLVAAVMAVSLRGCIKYEYEHEFWLDVDGSGTVYVTGRPSLWAAFKGVAASDDRADESRRAARELFERSGLRVRRVTWTKREGRPYLFVSADFPDVNALSSMPAFADLQVGLSAESGRLRLNGRWHPPPQPGSPPPGDRTGLMAVRFHLPSKVYEHHNAVGGVERGNIVAWRQEVQRALDGQPLAFGAVIDHRSILLSTVGLFAGAIAIGLAALGAAIYWTFRKGRAAARAPSPPPG
jgi:hypothetical protein